MICQRYEVRHSSRNNTEVCWSIMRSKIRSPSCLFGIASQTFFQFGPTDSNLIPGPGDRCESFLSSGKHIRIAASIRVGKFKSLCRFGPPDSNRFADSSRPTRIALPFRVFRAGRNESGCRFGPAASNCCDDSGRLNRIALSFRAGRFESLCRFGPAVSYHCTGSGATFASECRIGSPAIIALSLRVSRLDLLFRFWATRCARLSADSTFWRLAVLDFRLARLFGDKLRSTFG